MSKKLTNAINSTVIACKAAGQTLSVDTSKRGKDGHGDIVITLDDVPVIFTTQRDAIAYLSTLADNASELSEQGSIKERMIRSLKADKPKTKDDAPVAEAPKTDAPKPSRKKATKGKEIEGNVREEIKKPAKEAKREEKREENKHSFSEAIEKNLARFFILRQTLVEAEELTKCSDVAAEMFEKIKLLACVPDCAKMLGIECTRSLDFTAMADLKNHKTVLDGIFEERMNKKPADTRKEVADTKSEEISKLEKRIAGLKASVTKYKGWVKNAEEKIERYKAHGKDPKNVKENLENKTRPQLKAQERKLKEAEAELKKLSK